jgi:hypothetical protein
MLKNKISFLKILFLMLFFLLLISLNCKKRFQGIDYYPLKMGNSYDYSGSMGKSEVTNEVGDGKEKVYTISFYDQKGKTAWTEEFVAKEGRVFLRSFNPAKPVMPSFSFFPPLPFTPVSNKMGDTEAFQISEYHADSSVVNLKVKVDYAIEGIEDLSVPAGNFKRCIKMRMTYSYLDTTSFKFMEGDSRWWYAKGVGMVKYQFMGGSGELLSARIGDKSYP